MIRVRRITDGFPRQWRFPLSIFVWGRAKICLPKWQFGEKEMEGQSKEILGEMKEIRSLSKEIMNVSKEIRIQQKEMEGEPKDIIFNSEEILIKP
jgi:hypothetical protein